ncbi:allophanate hydrolase [Piscinibacter gummiphilus]|uniref:Allophanate hydrolase n=1 Tax=Piscinibacter gummiphilus TaxID=946333 RepID=A0ABZ0D2A6_9BURK|nr:allophanate hydrolase [Piscinibacter gummiphilus]WOB09372.1 allophanate hydrolase [Piscinibacter gummiphilus]
MTTSDPRTLAELQQALRSGTITVRQLMLRFLKEQTQHAPQAWISRPGDDALLAQADACDAALLSQGAAIFATQPLLGMPFGVKDNIDVAGLPTTAACKGFAAGPAAAHAVAVGKLVAAGAIPVGKTNLDQFATGLVGTRSPYGAVPNSFDPTRVSGGSSSGSAYAVATGQVPFALGTDTAGSGRVPAGFNNIVGLKPTPGRVSTTGLLPACRSIDCLSVLALTADDAARVLAVMEGPDPTDAYSRFAPGLAKLKPKLRVGIPAVPVFKGDAGYRETFAQACAHVQSLGHEVVPLDFTPLHATAELLYGGPWVAERHAAVERVLDEQPEAFDPSVRSIVESARHFSATDAFRGLYKLRAAQAETASFWSQADVLMVPTAPAHPTMAEVAADPIGANAQLGSYTNFVNLLGWCAIALPFNFTVRGLPFGVTFIAPGGFDAALARFGAEWQSQLKLPLGALRREAPLAPTLTRAPASTPTLGIAVVGAHLSGLPLNGQLTERGASLRLATTTAPQYRLYALPGTVPPKPGLQRVGSGGAAIAVEVWDVPLDQIGSFLALIPAPLGLGSLTLADGSSVHGFVCEALALDGARDITEFGGWRAYLASLKPAS